MDALPDIARLAVPLYLVLIVAEGVALSLRYRDFDYRYDIRDTVTSMGLGIGYLVFALVFASTSYAAIAFLHALAFEHRLLDISSWTLGFVVAFVLGDFTYYWNHRLEHEIRWGWANHVVHHSSKRFNLSLGLRQPWFGFLTGTFALTLPLAWLGIHPVLIAFALSINLFYQFFIHTELVDRLPPALEYVLNTPSHHRVHHGRNPKYVDRNYGGVFIVWDRLFGTFEPEDPNDPVDYGLVKNVETYNPVRLAVQEYVSIARDALQPCLTPIQRLRYIFDNPGYSHDGTRQTSRQIRKQALGMKQVSGDVSVLREFS